MKISFAQLFCRLSLGIGFISADLDRFGYYGAPGAPGVTWGNWEHFFLYSKKLMYFLPDYLIQICAITASVAEAALGILLIIGLFTRLTSFFSSLLLFFFALTMAFSMGIHAPLSYSVFTACSAALLLSYTPEYKWSLDSFFKRR